jgi:hypothetical protein
MRMRIASGCLVLAASLALASCGSSSSSSSSTAPVAASTSTTTATSTGSATSSSSSPSVATTPVLRRPPRCRAAGLALRFLGQQGATGHGELGFSLRNVSGARCRTFGFPGILFLGPSGQALPTVAVRRTHDLFGSAPAVSIILARGARASFRIGVTHGINSSAGCRTAAGLQVIPPDDTVPIRTTIPNGAYECMQATVSPLRPGLSAYP